MTSRGALVCVAVLCAALSAAFVAGEAVESADLLSAQGEQGGRMLLTGPVFTPAWVSHDGKVYALQGNFISGNTLQAGGKGDQQANSVAVNNAQINKNSDENGAVVQSNSIYSGRKLMTLPGPPKTITKDGKVYAFQGNLFSGNTLQAGGKGDQQANSVAVNNAQINKNSDENGAVVQGNSIYSGRKLMTLPGPPKTITKDGKVYAFQGNLVSGNTVQFGDKGDQQANSVAANNAQINKNSDQNGYIQQTNSKSTFPTFPGGL